MKIEGETLNEGNTSESANKRRGFDRYSVQSLVILGSLGVGK